MKGSKKHTNDLNVASAITRLGSNQTSGHLECRHLTEGNGPPGVDIRLSILGDQCARPFKTKRGLKLFVHTKRLNIFRFKCSVCTEPNEPTETNVLSMYAKFQLHPHYGF